VTIEERWGPVQNGEGVKRHRDVLNAMQQGLKAREGGKKKKLAGSRGGGVAVCPVWGPKKKDISQSRHDDKKGWDGIERQPAFLRMAGQTYS